LVVEWFVACCDIEKPVEAQRVHNSPPFIILSS
jgi:hypothetical protein